MGSKMKPERFFRSVDFPSYAATDITCPDLLDTMTGLYSDLMIQTDQNVSFCAHQAVLASRSTFLNDIFKNNPTPLQVTLVLPEVRTEVVEGLLQILYEGRLVYNGRKFYTELLELYVSLGFYFEGGLESVPMAKSVLASGFRSLKVDPTQHLEIKVNHEDILVNTTNADEEIIDIEIDEEDCEQKMEIQQIEGSIPTVQCLQCNFNATKASYYREHVSLKHYKRELIQLFVDSDGQCSECDYNGNLIARHVGAKHKKVDQLLTTEEAKNFRLFIIASKRGTFDSDYNPSYSGGETSTSKKKSVISSSPLRLLKKKNMKNNKKKPQMSKDFIKILGEDNLPARGVIQCLQCDWQCLSICTFREHLSIKHYRLALESKYVNDKACTLCGYTGQSVVRHIGSVHKKVDELISIKEKMILQEWKVKRRTVAHKEGKNKSEVNENHESCNKNEGSHLKKEITFLDQPDGLGTPYDAPCIEVKSVVVNKEEETITKPRILNCLQCSFQCEIASHLREHLSLKHYKEALEETFCKDMDECPYCGFSGKLLARHVGCSHKKVDDLATPEEKAILASFKKSHANPKTSPTNGHIITRNINNYVRSDSSSPVLEDNLQCLQCGVQCSSIRTYKEHLSICHYSTVLMSEFTKDGKKCTECEFEGSGLAEHVGTVHNRINLVVTEEELNQMETYQDENKEESKRPNILKRRKL